MLNLSGCVKLRKLHPSIGRLRKLTLLNLSLCTSLIKLPPFIDNPNLETLNLEGCKQLKEINPSIGLLRKLIVLSLHGCENLISLPNSILCLNSLEYLNLEYCSKLFGTRLLHKPMIEEEVKKLCISKGAISSRSTSSIMKKWFMSSLHLFHSRAHNDSVSCLFPSLHALPCIRELDLGFCNLVRIPDAIRNLNFLEALYLEGNNFFTLPSLKELSRLSILNLKLCRELKYLPEFPSQTQLTSQIRRRDMSLMVPLFIRKLEKTVRLNSYGCTELVEMEGYGSRALSWTIQLIQAHYLYKNPWVMRCGIWAYEPHISSIIPGSEIPSWFNNQHEGMGSIITVDLSPLMRQANNHHEDIGLLCCLLFSPPSPSILKKSDYQGEHIVLPLYRYRLAGYRLPEEHLWLFYLIPPRPTVTGSGAHSEWKLGIRAGNGFAVEVKKYGYLWLHVKELQEIREQLKETTVPTAFVNHTQELEASSNMDATFATIRPNKDAH
ncbi:hypothetical protein Fmac_028358 [Flemingia macrophylla]|uniref:Uncharacterized protein n=1 Tax=Flemingia macrophylla TaxID=520843 RepID=A0ABD1L794_9FABA